jgi:hypothetical protein
MGLILPGGYAVNGGLLPHFAASPVEAYVDAAGLRMLVPTAQIDALRAYTSALKDAGILSKMAALYPFMGGVAASHKYNAIDPALHQIAFEADVAHSLLKGMEQGNSSAQNKGVISSLGFEIVDGASYHLSVYYKGTQSNRVPCHRPDVLVTSNGGMDGNGYYLQMIARNADGQCYNTSGDWSTYIANPPRQDGLNVHSVEAGSSQFKYYKRGVLAGTGNRSNVIKPTSGGQTQIGCNSIDGTTLVSIGQGLSQAEITTFTVLTNTFQAALGRGV